jgi:hypothetical protein
VQSKLPVQLQHDSNGNVDKTVENQSTCNLNIQRNSHALKLGTRNRYRESSEFDIETLRCSHSLGLIPQFFQTFHQMYIQCIYVLNSY